VIIWEEIFFKTEETDGKISTTVCKKNMNSI